MLFSAFDTNFMRNVQLNVLRVVRWVFNHAH